MATNSDASLAKNVTNFETLISVVTSLGATYNPSKDSLKLPALQTLHSAATDSMTALKNAESATATAVDTRELAFKSIGSLFTRINNALKASNSTVQADETAKTIFRKLQGKRASAKLTDDEKTALKAEGKEVNQISAAQLSYNSKLENFDRLIMLLSSIPLYNPNEAELKVETLKALHNQLKEKNSEVILPIVQLSNSRIARNKILYKENTGIVDIAVDSKTYIKSVFGATSPQYKQVSRLYFKNRE